MALQIQLQSPVNLLSGYVIQSTFSQYAVDGCPAHLVSSPATFTDLGYYEVDVFDPGGTVIHRYPICIVNPPTLGVGASTPDSGEPGDFARMSVTLADAYPKSPRVLPSSTGRDFGMNITTSSAVALELRQYSGDMSYVVLGQALAKTAGIWRSGSFALPRGPSDIRLAVVISSQSLVLT